MIQSLTKGNPAKLIFLFTIPLIIGNLFQQLYNVADTYIVGRYIGIGALAAVGSTGNILFLILGFIFGFTTGLTIITAQRYGAEDWEGMRRSYAAGLLISTIATVVLTIPSLLLAKPLLRILNTPAEIFDDAYRYLMVILIGIFSSMFFNFYANILRALGNSRTPLYFLALVCVLNILLDLLFVIVFHLGVIGAGVATVISQLVSAVLCYAYIRHKLPELKLNFYHFSEAPRVLSQHLLLALPMGFQKSIVGIGFIILQFALNNLGTQAVAAYTTATKIDGITIMPLESFGLAMATYAAQNLGAGEYQRIKDGVKKGLAMALAYSFSMGVIMIASGGYLTQIFIGSGPETESILQYANIYFRINGSTYWAVAILFILRYTLQGIGQTFAPTLGGVLELLMRSFAAVALGAVIGFTGVAMANPLAWVGALIPLGIQYYREVKRMDRLMRAS
jgi:putative MATE family efflux protein